MTTRMSGRDVLALMDRQLSTLRGRVAEAIKAADSIDGRRAHVRTEQVEAFQKLADIRLDVIEAQSRDDLDRVHQQARGLLDAHAVYVRDEAQRLEAAAQAITALERQRTDLATEREAALQTYEARVAAVEEALKTSPDYKAALAAHDKAAAIAARAQQKLAVANDELGQKGEPYRTDPLFSYLWRRRFGTPDYKAGALTRFLDGWVARICKYAEARANFQRLNDIPVWLAEHAAAQDTAAAQARTALEATEREALVAAGTDQLRDQANALLARLAGIDQAIVQAETKHSVLAEQHAKALNEETGPAQDARRLLEDGLRRMSFADLRVLASETVSLADDELVDRLVRLRKEELSLELETERVAALPGRLQDDLSRLERLRREFKQAQFDRPEFSLRAAIVEDTLARLEQGDLRIDEAFSRLRQSVKRRSEPVRRGGFGGYESLPDGLPDVFEGDLGDVLGTVAIEVLKHATRGSSISFPSRERSIPRSSPPRRSGGSGSGKRGGGFKTGGGF